MHETMDKCTYTCLTCLTTTNRLYSISIELRDEYKKIVEMETEMETEEIEICNICHWQLHKFFKFKQQCQSARAMLLDTVDTKLILCQNLERTITDVHSFAMLNYELHENLAESPVNNPPIDDSPQTDGEVKSSIGSPIQDDEFDNEYDITNGNDEEYLQEKITIENLSLNNSLINNSSDDLQDYDTEINDDESLLSLKLSERAKKRKREIDMVEEDIKPSIDEIIPKKSKKKVKEGFSSRMVQETDEYEVIKLTRNQVLEEMAERSKTELYMNYPFKCEKCVKGFNFQDVLRTHMEKHNKKYGSFHCDICYQYCRSAVSLRGHIKSHTTRYKCKLCSIVRICRQHLLEHFYISHTIGAATYSCDSCTFQTTKRTVMQRHAKNHDKTERHACEQCGKLFKNMTTLRVHTVRHNKSSKYRCTQCDVSFVYQSLLRRHVTQVHERRDYYCVECDAQFNSSESLKLHFKKGKYHRDASTFKSSVDPPKKANAICQKWLWFTSRYVPLRFECSQCSARCLTAGSLAAHCASAHGAPRSHACSLCRRLYSSREGLRSHVWRAHTKRHTTTTDGANNSRIY